MSPRRSIPSEIQAEKVWGLGEVSFSPNFSATLSGKQIRKLTTTPKKPRASVSLSYGGYRPAAFGELPFGSLPFPGAQLGGEEVHLGTSGRGLCGWAWPREGMRAPGRLPG